MAVELTKAIDHRVLAGRLVFQPDANTTVSTGITQHTSGEIFIVKINNIANSAAVYVKLVDGTSATPGTTHPDWIFYAAGGATVSYVMPLGVPYSAGLSLWAATGAESTGGDSNVSPTNDVIVHIVAI